MIYFYVCSTLNFRLGWTVMNVSTMRPSDWQVYCISKGGSVGYECH